MELLNFTGAIVAIMLGAICMGLLPGGKWKFAACTILVGVPIYLARFCSQQGFAIVLTSVCVVALWYLLTAEICLRIQRRNSKNY